jgi:curli biogenesis system outer membrane secretion channel CsgG
MRMKATPILLAGTLILTACAKKDDAKAVGPATSVSKPSPSAPMPDAGGIEHVSVSTQGIGATPDAAVQEALRLAVMEVNGESIDAGSVAVKFGLDVASGQTEESLRGSAFAEAIAARSKGTVSNFKLVSLVEPSAAGQPYKANIEASIAKFTAPADSKKLKIVLSPIRFSTNEFDVGGTAVPAAKIAGEVRQRLIDALTATGRFSVLDRDFGPEVQSELDLVATGQTPSDQMAKLSQTVSADIVWVGTLNDFSYHRNARHLEMAGRDLVSYSGGWSVSQRILNVSTRQIMLSDTLEDELAPTEPTTMDRGVDGAALAAKMESEVVDRTVSAILLRTFPLVVISKDGTNVVLSQGGQAVKAGSSYSVVSLGKELKDPQTGESLGYTETPCCEVVVDRVSDKLAYGHLENVKIDLASIDPVALQVREEIQTKALGSAAATTAPQSSPASPPAKVSKAIAAQANPAAIATADSKNADDSRKW